MNRTLAVGLLFIVGACRDSAAPALAPPSSDSAIWATPRILVIPTVDGSGTVVHPDYVHLPPTWPGPARYLAITTYPKADANREWPSIFTQDSASTNWHLVPGTPNPILETLPPSIYSDPDIVYEPDSGQLWMYVRLVNAEWNVLQVVRSGDGIHWTAPVDLDSARNHGMISPTVVRRDRGDWYLWSVHATYGGCSQAGSTFLERRTSTDGISWSAPDSVSIAGHPWHIDIEWVPERQEWWALYVEGCMPTSVRLATSGDGMTWTTLPSPVLTAGVLPEFRDVVYRSTLAVEGDSVRFWFSGAHWNAVNDSEWVWHAAASVEGVNSLLQRLSRVPTSAPRPFSSPGHPVPYPEEP